MIDTEKVPSELVVKLYGSETAQPFLVYECEHVTNGTYNATEAIPVGSQINILLCKHCWEHVRGMAAQAILKEAIRSIDGVWDGMAKQ